MAAQGCCRDCDAAFVHPPVKGYIPCPLCSKTLERTSKLYTGAWFSVDGAKSPYALRFQIEPIGDLASRSKRVVWATIAYVKAKQAACVAAWELTWIKGQADNPYMQLTPAQHADRVQNSQWKSDRANAAQERAYNLLQSQITGMPNPDNFTDPIDYAEAAEYARLGI